VARSDGDFFALCSRVLPILNSSQPFKKKNTKKKNQRTKKKNPQNTRITLKRMFSFTYSSFFLSSLVRSENASSDPVDFALLFLTVPLFLKTFHVFLFFLMRMIQSLGARCHLCPIGESAVTCLPLVVRCISCKSRDRSRRPKFLHLISRLVQQQPSTRRRRGLISTHGIAPSRDPPRRISIQEGFTLFRYKAPGRTFKKRRTIFQSGARLRPADTEAFYYTFLGLARQLYPKAP